MATNGNTITVEDRKRFHELLDYALDEAEDYAIMRFAEMSLDFQLHVQEYRLHFKKYDETKFQA
jgi:hypothetical protein